jgi:hypothetical protein
MEPSNHQPSITKWLAALTSEELDSRSWIRNGAIQICEMITDARILKVEFEMLQIVGRFTFLCS